MLPVLFSDTATTWTSFGIGVLSDAIKCVVEENRNGAYELELTYPITGALYSEIALRRIIVAKPNYTDNAQPFRIYQISKPLNGIVTVSAQHISYDLSGYVDAPFTASGPQAAVAQMTNSLTIYPTSCPFTLSTNMSNTTTMTLKHPESVRALMGGVEGSLVDNFGGEWHFDGYTCELLSARGANRGASIRYGKNMTDLRQEENNAAVYTGVYPYYYNSDTDTLVVLPSKVINLPGTFGYTRIYKLDLTSEFEEAPTTTELRAKAQSYIDNNDIGVPKVNLTVKFVEANSLAERIDLCDTVSVRFDDLGVSATAKCIRTKWDVLEGRYIEAELGNARNSLAGTIVDVKQAAENATKNAAAIAGAAAADVAEEIANKVTGNIGGYVILHDTNSDGEPDELLVMNTDDISTATKIIRINNGGIAFSSTGYNGTYSTAWNIDGEFVADFIASGTIAANLVKIQGDTCFYWDAANITMVDPTNSRNMIRLGKYDGTNYGLGFSTDGGSTWSSGFNFNGITMVKNVSSTYCKLTIDGSGITFTDSSNAVFMYLGLGSVSNASGAETTGSYFRFGTFGTLTRPGIMSLSAGGLNIPTGAYSSALGYSNTASGNYSSAMGAECTASGNYSFAEGHNNTASGLYAATFGKDCQATAQGAIAIGYDAQATDNGAVAIGEGAKASAYQAVAINYNEAKHIGAFVVGTNNVSTGPYQLVCGTTAVPNVQSIFVAAAPTVGNCIDVRWNGNVYIAGTLTQGSDARLKEVIGEAPDLSSVRAVRFRWNNKKPWADKEDHIGYIAQEVQELAPYLVRKDGNGYLTLDYDELLCAKVEQLERTVKSLTERISNLEAGNASAV